MKELIKAPEGYKYVVVDDTTVRLEKVEEPEVEFFDRYSWIKAKDKLLSKNTLKELEDSEDYVEVFLAGDGFDSYHYRYFANVEEDSKRFIRRVKR